MQPFLHQPVRLLRQGTSIGLHLFVAASGRLYMRLETTHVPCLSAHRTHQVTVVPVTTGPHCWEARPVRGRCGGRDVLPVHAHLVRDLPCHFHVAAALKS